MAIHSQSAKFNSRCSRRLGTHPSTPAIWRGIRVDRRSHPCCSAVVACSSVRFPELTCSVTSTPRVSRTSCTTTLHEKILPLGDDVMVHPTHGAGSFCTAAAAAESTSTIGRERRGNPFLALPDPEVFAERLLASMPSYPTCFDSMRAVNRRGPRVLGELPRLALLTPHDVQARQRLGQAVVDTRSIYDYARGHIPGVFHVELRPAFASWVGWVVPFGTPVILVSETTEVHEYAVRRSARTAAVHGAGWRGRAPAGRRAAAGGARPRRRRGRNAGGVAGPVAHLRHARDISRIPPGDAAAGALPAPPRGGTRGALIGLPR